MSQRLGSEGSIAPKDRARLRRTGKALCPDSTSDLISRANSRPRVHELLISAAVSVTGGQSRSQATRASQGGESNTAELGTRREKVSFHKFQLGCVLPAAPSIRIFIAVVLYQRRASNSN